MTTYLKQALDEWNRRQPPWRPFLHSIELLSASERSRVGARAKELEVADCLGKLFPGHLPRTEPVRFRFLGDTFEGN